MAKPGRKGKRYVAKNLHATFKIGTQRRAVYDAVLAAGKAGVTSAEIVAQLKDDVPTKGSLSKHVAFHLCGMKKDGTLAVL